MFEYLDVIIIILAFVAFGAWRIFKGGRRKNNKLIRITSFIVLLVAGGVAILMALSTLAFIVTSIIF